MLQAYHRGRYTVVKWQPQVVAAEGARLEAAERADTQANGWGLIANSMNFPVRHEATVIALG